MNAIGAAGRKFGFLLGFLVAAMAPSLAAAPPLCPDSDVGRVAVAADGLQIIALSAPGLRPGDVLLQMNSRVLRSCTDLAEAIAEAREHQLAQLFFVRRGHGTEAVVVPPPVVAGVAAPIPATALSQPAPTPAAIGPSTLAPIRDLLVQLVAFGRTLRENSPLLTAQPWARQSNDLRQTYEKRQAEVSAVRMVEPIIGYYQTIAEILVYRDEAAREGGSARPQPNMSLSYNSGTRVSAWLRRYPFLEASVIAFPETTAFAGWAESNGRWSPDRAVELLVERALAEADTLARRLDTNAS